MYAIKLPVAVIILLGVVLLFMFAFRGERKSIHSSGYSNSTEVAVVVIR